MTLDRQDVLIEWLLDQHGLGTPTSFRAGAWMAEENLLQALSLTGFVAESSALNTSLISEEWADFGTLYATQHNNVLWSWNAEHWDQIDATSQPYYPSATDAQAPGDLSVLQLPDNGALVDCLGTE